MHDIICPHCNKAFKVDETGYADILKQVRDADFHAQLHERLELAEQDKRNAVALAQAQVANELQKAAAAKDAQIQALKAQLDAGAVERDLAVAHALSAVEKQRDALANELERARQAQQAADQLAQARLAQELQGVAAQKDAEIQQLKSQLEAGEVVRRLAVTEAVTVVARERDELKNDLNLVVVKKQLEEAAIKEQYALQLRDRDGEIGRGEHTERVHMRDEIGDILIRRIGDNVARGAKLHHPPAFHQRDPVAEFERLIEVVADEDDRAFELLLQL